jgi:hypothetical protein
MKTKGFLAGFELLESIGVRAHSEMEEAEKAANNTAGTENTDTAEAQQNDAVEAVVAEDLNAVVEAAVAEAAEDGSAE